MDVTGSVELGARTALEAFEHGKHFVAMNAELDGTLGPILHTYARKHGVEFSACDGDEPGLQMNLYRWVRGLGLEPRVMGNVKGLQDPYRNAGDAEGLRGEVGSEPRDGHVVRGRLEDQLRADDRGQRDGRQGAPAGDVPRHAVRRARRSSSPRCTTWTRLRALGSIVDYTVGPSSVKIFCLAEHEDPKQRHYLSLYKMGDGPLYPFWVPYHLPAFRGADCDRAGRPLRGQPRTAPRRARAWRCAPSRSAISAPARRSTSTGCS